MTTETTPRSPAATAEAYVSFWNLAADEQRTLGATLFASDVARSTPIGESTGLEALIDFTRQFTEGVGAYTFVARAEPDSHHGHVRVRWEILKEEGSFAEGTDVLGLDRSGRIAAITAFIDRAPEGFDPDAHHEEG
ncbi:isomerase [Nocardioides sp. NPDC059952]|uniref:isomerase n=1 Tax=Nocardioides sp. NPDC059952 TaxID=3347014 RepID=UPI003652FFE3